MQRILGDWDSGGSEYIREPTKCGGAYFVEVARQFSCDLA